MSDPLDPRLFDPANIDPRVKTVNDVIEKALAEAPATNTQQPAELREARERGEGPFGPPKLVDEASWRQIETPAGPQEIRVIAPENARAVYLHIHGGGWTLGAPHHSDERNLQIAQRCGVAVVSVRYRLAPEHPYPAGPDDCERACAWLIENAKREFGTDRLLIGGESAGAHLSVVTLLRMRDRHGYSDFLGANLTYGCYDLRGTPSVRNWGERNLILSTPIIDWFLDQFTPDASVRGDADPSPLLADVSGLCPALFTVGTLDPLIDDTLFMYMRWIAAGLPAELAIWPGCIHGWNTLPLPLTDDANARIDAFLSGRLG